MNWKILIEVLECNGCPKLDFFWAGEKILTPDIKPGIQTINFSTSKTLPNKLVIKQSGKNMKNDTVMKGIDITKDKACIIRKIAIDDITLIHECHLFDFHTQEGSKLNTNYLGFNGDYVIDINEQDIEMWYTALHNQLYTTSKFDYAKFREEIFGEAKR